MTVVRIGTRNSKLAIAQADLVRCEVTKLSPNNTFEIIGINSQGDRKRDLDPSAPRDKKDWIIDIEEALMKGEIDIAVHSAKDVPMEVDSETVLIPVLQRAKPNDIFIANKLLVPSELSSLEMLPENLTIGTSSLRRQAQLKRLRPDLSFVPIRGNIPTRIRKVQEEIELAGIIISCASIERLALKALSSQILPVETFCPAVNQGILMAQCRKDDKETQALLQRITDVECDYCCWAERAFIAKIGADCHSAIAVFCAPKEGFFQITAEVYSVADDKFLKSVTVSIDKESPILLGQRLAEDLILQGALTLLGPN